MILCATIAAITTLTPMEYNKSTQLVDSIIQLVEEGDSTGASMQYELLRNSDPDWPRIDDHPTDPNKITVQNWQLSMEDLIELFDMYAIPYVSIEQIGDREYVAVKR